MHVKTKLEETNQPASQKVSGRGQLLWCFFIVIFSRFLSVLPSEALSTQKLPKSACLSDQGGIGRAEPKRKPLSFEVKGFRFSLRPP